MSKQVKEILTAILILLVFFCVFNVVNNINKSGFTTEILEDKMFLVSIFAIIILLFILFVRNAFFGKQKAKELKYRDKLFNSLVLNSDTIYAMYNYDKREYIYITKNVESVLGVKLKDKDKTGAIYIDEIFNNPALRTELDDWNRKSEFVSQMISYRNLNYQHTRWLKIKIYPFRDKKNNYHVILISDVTKEHDQQHLLVVQALDIKTREKQLNQITEASYDLEIDLNLDTKEFSLKNLKPGISYLGKDTSGNYVLDFESLIENYVNKEDIKYFKEVLSLAHLTDKASKKDYEPLNIRYRLKNNDIWLESTAFFTSNKGEMHITILTKNVTENAEYMRNQNIMLQNALDESKKANKAKDEFLSIMSHEIRTPMNTIVGLSSSILSEKLPTSIKEDIENINEASNNLVDIIDGILDISKMEKGGLNLNEKEYITAEFFKEIEKYATQNLKNEQVKIVLSVAPNMPSKLYGDSSKIKQILSNLIDNAIKFTTKGTISINALGNKKGGFLELKIEITDTGIGIEKNKIDMLFDETKKTTKDTKKYIGGMGLSIAKKIIDTLNGEISVTSTKGKGTTFTVILTQKIVDNKAIGNIDEYITKKRENNCFDAHNKNILVVDDNKLNIRVAEKLLKPYNLNIHSVYSGYEALELLKENTYDLIFLDQMMPGLSGTETLHEMQRQKDFNTPVVVLTADALVGKKEEYLNEGFSDYLSKPVNNDELYNILKKYLKR